MYTGHYNILSMYVCMYVKSDRENLCSHIDVQTHAGSHLNPNVLNSGSMYT